MEQRVSEPLTILLLEDNPADVYLVTEALKETGITFDAITFNDGESAYAYVQNNPAQLQPRPDLAILDLNVPKRDGAEVLASIRSSAELKDMPVVVLSSSPQSIMRDRTAQADCYLEKPNDYDMFLSIGEQILACFKAAREKHPHCPITS